MIFTMSFGTVSTAFAADDDASGSYEYVVKIYPGLKGTYKGNAKVTTLHKKLGESVSMNVYTDVEVTDARGVLYTFAVTMKWKARRSAVSL